MFTYDFTALADSPLYQLRLLIGQTNPNSILVMHDEELNYLLSLNDNNVNQSALDALNSLISRALELTDKTTGQVSEDQSQILDNLYRLRDDLLNSISRSVPTYAQFTGVFIDDMNEINNDPELFHDSAVRKNRKVYRG